VNVVITQKHTDREHTN